ncbi:MAG TPA: TolC family protein [Paludibaculum sp.]|jgi:outer membrane protein TolC
MRVFALVLTFALLASAQQQPGVPATAGAPAAPAKQVLGEGAQASLSSDLGNFDANWIGTGSWYRKAFKADSNVTLSPPVRLKDYVADGTLRLSLRGYLDLVIANNTDLSIQRLSLELPKNAIQRAFGVFDPLVTSSFGATRANTPTSNALDGATILSNLSQPFSLRYQQLTPFSTQFFSTLNWTKTSNNNSFQLYNPSLQNTWQMGFNQPLIRNRGRDITKLGITIARAQRVAQEISFQDTVLRSLVTAENAYWDVVNARERIKVQKEALRLAEASLERTNKEISLGATSELERFQPEQNAATQRIALTQFEFQLTQFEDVLRRQIGADLDPDARKLRLELTEDVTKAPDEAIYDKESLVGVALQKRPDLRAVKANLTVNDYQIRSTRELLKPLMNLSAFYQTFGRGGPLYATGRPVVPGGAADAWGQMFGFNYSTYNFSLNLNLPLRDRAAAANLADAVVNKRSNTLRERSVEQQVRQEVLNAVTNVESSREGVKLAVIALDYAKKRADADQKRYDLGVINIFFLLSAQNDLTVAQSNLVTQTINYKRNVLTMQQRLGTLLEDKGIVID